MYMIQPNITNAFYETYLGKYWAITNTTKVKLKYQSNTNDGYMFVR
jgi:hypothetical protein